MSPNPCHNISLEDSYEIYKNPAGMYCMYSIMIGKNWLRDILSKVSDVSVSSHLVTGTF